MRQDNRLEAITLIGIVIGGRCPGVICPGSHLSQKDIIRVKLSGGNFPRRELYGCNCPGVIVRGGNCPSWELSREKCLGGICPRCQLSGGQLPGGPLSREQLSWGQLSRGNCPVPLYTARIWLNLITFAE